MKRLTIKAPSGLIHLKDNTETTMNTAIKKLSDLEDLEEQGKLLKLPCTVGSLVYEPYQYMGEGAWEIDVHKIRLEDLGKIGKTVFLAREAAEAALKEMSE